MESYCERGEERPAMELRRLGRRYSSKFVFHSTMKRVKQCEQTEFGGRHPNGDGEIANEMVTELSRNICCYFYLGIMKWSLVLICSTQ